MEQPAFPPIITNQTHPPCGLRSSSMGSYCRLVCAKKDTVSPLRPQKHLPAPKERFFQYKRMAVTADDLKVWLIRIHWSLAMCWAGTLCEWCCHWIHFQCYCLLLWFTVITNENNSIERMSWNRNWIIEFVMGELSSERIHLHTHHKPWRCVFIKSWLNCIDSKCTSDITFSMGYSNECSSPTLED